MAGMSAATLVVGALLLVLGRRLFWVFLAGTGFLMGAWLSVEFLGQQPESVRLAAAVVLGFLGAMLALMAQKVAVGLGGFLAGVYLGQVLSSVVMAQAPVWVMALVGGVLGAILLSMLFNWALIVLSSLLGAAVISQNLPLPAPWPPLVFVVLLLVGLAWQSRQYTGRKGSKKKED